MTVKSIERRLLKLVVLYRNTYHAMPMRGLESSPNSEEFCTTDTKDGLKDIPAISCVTTASTSSTVVSSPCDIDLKWTIVEKHKNQKEQKFLLSKTAVYTGSLELAKHNFKIIFSEAFWRKKAIDLNWKKNKNKIKRDNIIANRIWLKPCYQRQKTTMKTNFKQFLVS